MPTCFKMFQNKADYYQKCAKIGVLKTFFARFSVFFAKFLEKVCVKIKQGLYLPQIQ